MNITIKSVLNGYENKVVNLKENLKFKPIPIVSKQINMKLERIAVLKNLYVVEVVKCFVHLLTYNC